MARIVSLKAFISARLSAFAEEIFQVIETSMTEYETELEKKRAMLDAVLQPQVQLTRIDESASTKAALLPRTQPSNASHTNKRDESASIKAPLLPRKQVTQPSNASHTNIAVDAFPLSTDDPYGCNFCGKLYLCTKLLSFHTKTHLRDKQFCCSTCSKRFSRLGDLEDHTLDHPSPRPFGCCICGKTFVKPGIIRNHVNSHKKQDPYFCNRCGRPYSRMHDLVAHARCHWLDNPFFCIVCRKGMPTEDSLVKHMRSHREKPFSCDICEGRFYKRVGLRRHLKNFPNNSCARLRKPTPPAELTLTIEPEPQADQPVGTKEVPTEQLSGHTADKPFPCSLCEMRFVTKSRLKMHTGFHSGEKPHVCKSCGMKFCKWSNFKRHMQKCPSSTSVIQIHHRSTITVGIQAEYPTLLKKEEMEEIPIDQQLNLETVSSLDQQDRKPPQMEEQQGLCSSLEGENMKVKEEAEDPTETDSNSCIMFVEPSVDITLE